MSLQTSNAVFRIKVPTAELAKHKILLVNIPGLGMVKVSLLTEKSDDLENYCKNFLQWYFLFLTLSDAIAEGDMRRTNIALKMMIPYFYAHSPLSKYLVECIDYILKTEVLLSQQMSFNVRCASFINMSGGEGKNVASDMEKEHQVKYLKDLIRGLGSNKTEHSIEAVCMAGPVVVDVIENFDKITGYKNYKSTHKSRPIDKDFKVLSDHMHKLRPFNKIPGRCFEQFKSLPSNTLESIETAKFNNDILVIAERLQRNLPIQVVETDNVQED